MPLPNKICSRNQLFEDTPALLERGDWVCLDIDPSVAWPSRAQSLDFADQLVWIIPHTLEAHPGVALRRTDGLSSDEAEAILYQALSVIAWRESFGIIVAHATSGDLPRMMGLGQRRSGATREPFDFTEVICPQDDRTRLALALMREARSLNHAGYAFLSFWRIIEVAFPAASVRTPWMTAALDDLSDREAVEAVALLRQGAVNDIGRHLFQSGRCAIAHATGHPVINPDDPRDARRMRQELPIVRALAVKAIEDQFGIETRSTEYRKHLYELRGWKRVLGDGFVAAIVAGQPPAEDAIIDLPAINIRLRTSPPYAPMEGLQPKGIWEAEGKLMLVYGSANGLFEIRFVLDLAAERLIFDFEEGLRGTDDGSVVAAEYRRDIERFIRDYLLNGELQMWDVDTGALLSRLDAFLPMNCFVDLEACNANIARAEVEAERRRPA